MKVKKIMKRMFQACINGDKAAEKTYWFKSLKKSLNGKKTQSIR